MGKKREYKLYKNIWISTDQVLPGVWERKEGGYVVRGRAKDPTTGHMKEVFRVLIEADQAAALKWLKDEQARIRAGIVLVASPKMRFSEFAASHFEHKVTVGDIKSAATSTTDPSVDAGAALAALSFARDWTRSVVDMLGIEGAIGGMRIGVTHGWWRGSGRCAVQAATGLPRRRKSVVVVASVSKPMASGGECRIRSVSRKANAAMQTETWWFQPT